MKKLHFLGMICLTALFLGAVVCCSEKEPNGGTNGEYVDLGLPSGTKWRDINEVNSEDAMYDFYTYDEAVAAFGNALPTKEQFEELEYSCQWSWTGHGYTVTGPNGNSIVLPAVGIRLCNGDVIRVGSDGGYWSSTPDGSDIAWFLVFGSGGVYMGRNYRCLGCSVRLVQD